jgi:hypothetical protein
MWLELLSINSGAVVTIEMWEMALSIRDNVYFQIFVLTLLAWIGYKIFIATIKTIWKAIIIGAAIFLFLILWGGSLANILLWNG